MVTLCHFELHTRHLVPSMKVTFVWQSALSLCWLICWRVKLYGNQRLSCGERGIWRHPRQAAIRIRFVRQALPSLAWPSLAIPALGWLQWRLVDATRCIWCHWVHRVTLCSRCVTYRTGVALGACLGLGDAVAAGMRCILCHRWSLIIVALGAIDGHCVCCSGYPHDFGFP